MRKEEEREERQSCMTLTFRDLCYGDRVSEAGLQDFTIAPSSREDLGHIR